MSGFLVFATSLSRLHADLLVVRLKQADVPLTQISVIHPKVSPPNSTLCWLSGSQQYPLKGSEKILVSGLLRNRLRSPSHRLVGHLGLAARLEKIGVDNEHGAQIEQNLLEGRLVISIELSDEWMAAEVIETLQLAGAESIRLVSMTSAIPEAESVAPREPVLDSPGEAAASINA